MKKTCFSLLLAALGLLIAGSSFAQDKGRAFYKEPYKSRNSGSFDANANVLTLGYGFPNLSGTDTWNGSFGPAYLKYEHGIISEVGVGGYIAFSGAHNDYSHYHDRLGAFSMGFLGYYHFNKLIPLKQLDVYAGAGIGFRIFSYHYDDNRDSHSDFDPLGLFKVGARWYFTPSFGVYAEGGYDGMSDVNLGVTFRF